MKPKRRVITTPGGRSGKRTPTVRRIRSAIVPAPPKGPSGTSRPVPGSPTAAARTTGTQPPGALEPPVASGFDGEVDLQVDLAPGRGGLDLSNPLVGAAGAFGFGVELVDVLDIERIGAIVTRGVTLKPRAGNPGRRVVDVPAGLLNSIGLQGPGVDAVIDRYAPTWARWSTPVIVNLAAGSAGDFAELARRLDGVPGVAGLELDLACQPSRGGTRFALDPAAAGAVVTAVRRATSLPVVAKLSAEATDVRSVARSVVEAGADAIAAINTVAGLAVAGDRSGPLLGTGYGGLSGPAIRPIALRVVYEIAQVVEVPIVGSGGVTGIDDVLDLLAVGASAVAVGTAALADPMLPVRLADELADVCRRQGLSSHRPLVGSALPARPAPPSARGVEYRP
ncbi:MAG TPA: dihydroorotate dehydrogenase [Candidatus Limnocylindrales bacterium]|nr:dihydroorotate dehydrogenase [Candidatus Limnocylindrales bacterium]